MASSTNCMSRALTVVDFGMGNLHSVRRKLSRLGFAPTVTSEPSVVSRADKLVLPGVGHFQKAMQNLRELQLLEPLHEAARVKQVPILGICLGMQLMAARSEEGNAEGLGWIDADVVRFRIRDDVRRKVPHMGWNRIHIMKESSLLTGLSDSSEFYFVHSYHLMCRTAGDVLCETEYAYPFHSAIECGNLFGVQFHPEKSHEAGEMLLRNFLAL